MGPLEEYLESVFNFLKNRGYTAEDEKFAGYQLPEVIGDFSTLDIDHKLTPQMQKFSNKGSSSYLPFDIRLSAYYNNGAVARDVCYDAVWMRYGLTGNSSTVSREQVESGSSPFTWTFSNGTYYQNALNLMTFEFDTPWSYILIEGKDGSNTWRQIAKINYDSGCRYISLAVFITTLNAYAICQKTAFMLSNF